MTKEHKDSLNCSNSTISNNFFFLKEKKSKNLRIASGAQVDKNSIESIDISGTGGYNNNIIISKFSVDFLTIALFSSDLPTATSATSHITRAK